MGEKEKEKKDIIKEEKEKKEKATVRSAPDGSDKYMIEALCLCLCLFVCLCLGHCHCC